MTKGSEIGETGLQPRPRARVPLRRRIKRHHVLVALGALLGCEVLFYFLAVKPLDAREEEKRALVAGLRQQVADRREELEDLKLVVEKVQRAREEGDQLLDEITLERKTTYSVLVAELVEAAQQSGIELRESSFQLEPVEGAEQYGVMTISANLRGQYENLVKFLNRLDRSERFLIVESLGATPRSDTNELQIMMKVETFVRNL